MLRKILDIFGIDGAIGYSVLTRVIAASGGLVTLVFIALFLSTEEQGYYYTFGSIIAIQVFFELGLNGIITQYVAHETIHLSWTSNIELTGSKEHLSRLSSLLHFCLKVFTSLSIVLFIILSITGYVFFTKYHQGIDSVNWQLPWLLVVFATSIMLIINPLLAFLEGLGKVKEVAQMRLMQQIGNIASIAVVFVFKGGLFALGVASIISFIILFGNIAFTHRKTLLLYIYNSKGMWKVNYWKEIFPYQWKIALSWVSGYFIFQLFNPVLFATAGAKVAGQMGMTLAVLNGISSISMSWISTKVPLFSSLIAQKNFKTLDGIFSNTVTQLTGINFLGSVVFLAGVIILNWINSPYASRFLPFIYVLLLSFVTFTNQFVFSWATYLRCHKEEPFLINSIVIGVLCGLSTFILGKLFGLNGVVFGYTTISVFIGLPWAYFIFIYKKKQWHD